MDTYNHAFDFAFEVTSRDFYAKDVTPEMIRHAILDRLARLSDTELLEAVGEPFDTFKETN